MVVSVVQSLGKKLVVSVMSVPSRDFLVFKHALKTALEAARSNGLNMSKLCESKIEEEKTDD